ncbi:hypothetical protein EDD21DRAFT_203388 [Dissophora ornata]|nr:hypothetical protein EDD21DRAFT_203388 [Dissophora ornata]
MESKFVQDSVYIWPAIGKAHLNTSKRSKDGDNDNNVWNNVPQEVKDAKVIAVDHDYHGNFNAELFDRLFQRICQNLEAMNLGPCNIHLDGASYHFHRDKKRPNSTTKIGDILNWFREENHEIPTGANGGKPTKKDLL